VVLRLLAGVLLVACTTTPRVELLVDVRSDLVPGVEVDEALVRTEGEDDVLTPIGPDHTLAAGLRVARYAGLDEGDRRVEIALLRNGEVVLSRVAATDLVAPTTGLTVTMTRDCRDVECPGESGDPSFEACFGGSCGDPGCSDERPDLCPVGCTSDEDCAPVGSCATGRCDAGACFAEPIAGACLEDLEYCDPDVGCRVNPSNDPCEDEAESHDALGEGTPDEPHLLCNLAQLESLAASPADFGRSYRLLRDIDASGVPPIGETTQPFLGELDGGGHEVIVLHSTDSEAGLFGALTTGAHVHDLTVVGDVAGGDYVGLLAGRAMGGVVERVAVRGSARGDRFVGALLGDAAGAEVRGCTAELIGDVLGEGDVGGLVGRGGMILGAVVFGEGQVVATGSTVGGVAGSAAVLRDCHARVGVRGTFNVGGLAGRSSNEVFRCSAAGDVTSVAEEPACTNVGGLLGQASGTVRESFATGDATTTGAVVGGLVGRGTSLVVEDSFSTGAASGVASGTTSCSTFSPHAYVGGIVGWLSRGEVRRCWSATVATGGGIRGGIVGAAGAIGGEETFVLEDDVAVGVVTGDGSTGPHGGVVGAAVGSGTLANNWWDVSSGVSRMCGQQDTDSTREECMRTERGVDLSESPDRLRLASMTPLDRWDFDAVWVETDEEMPILRWQLSE